MGKDKRTVSGSMAQTDKKDEDQHNHQNDKQISPFVASGRGLYFHKRFGGSWDGWGTGFNEDGRYRYDYLERVVRIQGFPGIPKSVFARQEGGQLPGCLVVERARPLERHAGLDIGLQNEGIRELLQHAGAYQGRDIPGNCPAIFIEARPVAARLPTILLFRWIQHPKFIGQTLSPVAVAGHALEPVFLRAVVGLEWRFR